MGTVAYKASKFAARGMTKSIALMLADKGIRVNSVHPALFAHRCLTQRLVISVRVYLLFSLHQPSL